MEAPTMGAWKGSRPPCASAVARLPRVQQKDFWAASVYPAGSAVEVSDNPYGDVNMKIRIKSLQWYINVSN